ncbi:unnamed protein product [Chrysodeixis includens]|uniref:Pentatricopeptide repeat-containing protein 1, mitochondrial n=1 Tax=Chrysodeixis includens TaxID=689277 RepID=A0A9P0FSV2_CHRIL|nr:unnamed protein product [Chrysodeixis includens]
MALRCTKLLGIIRRSSVIRHNYITTTVALPEEIKLPKPKEYKTEDNLVFLEDPDNFGTLSKSTDTFSEELEDEGDKREQEFLQNVPVRSQKLTTNQYATIIKQYLKYRRLKEAIDVLEVRMLKEDRVKPENYIYNILIGACADVGYTKKAFKLFNEMKRRGLKPTGDTYTCLFNACANSPWPVDGLKNAKHLRELMIEKGTEPNLTNYNAMIKAFGRCGDIATAFKIVDEMTLKKIKIRVHTLNHLFHACISDKQNGLRHALIVWRKMLLLKEKPNIYTFNLMLKCVKDCNLGSKSDIEELISTIQSQMLTQNKRQSQLKLTESSDLNSAPGDKLLIELPEDKSNLLKDANTLSNTENAPKDVIVPDKLDVTIEFVNKLTKADSKQNSVPNLLSKVINMEHVTSLQEVHTLQDKFAVIGGQDGFLKEMGSYSVKPDVKTFTQMLPLLDNTTEAEDKLLKTMKSLEVKADIDFYNMLIKKRCLRLDYDAAVCVTDYINDEIEYRKKRYPHSKRLKLKFNIMTYGVLAMSCKTKESAEKLLSEMAEKQLKVNIEILGTLLRHGTASFNFGYVLYIMNVLKRENIQVNAIFLKHLENFNEKCIKVKENSDSAIFKKSFEIFAKFYTTWLKEMNTEEALKPEHPWQQFRQKFPETVQRDSVQIKEPKKFYKKHKKYVKYTPKIVN